MTVLLDTNVWLHWTAGSGALSKKALAAMKDVDNRVYSSAASAWEIAINTAMAGGRWPTIRSL